jgi:methionyl-tRNA formyltransferase
MHLVDVAMVAADTSRSRVYLQALIRNQLLPNFVLVLGNTADQTLPGQLDNSQIDSMNNGITENNECWSEAHCNLSEPIQLTLEASEIPYELAEATNINDEHVIACIKDRSELTFIYSGYGGVILGEPLFRTGKQFLHVHGGYLPNFKGSTTNYYSLIVDNSLGASSLFLNEEIDGGLVLRRRKFPPPADRTQIDHRYDSAARAKVLVETIQDYINSGEWQFDIDANNQGETYFIIHPILKHIAILSNQKTSRCE